MQSEHLISVTYWNHFLRYAQEHNVNLQQLGALSSLDATEHYIPLSHVKSLIAIMLEQGMPPWLGLEVADSISVSSHVSILWSNFIQPARKLSISASAPKVIIFIFRLLPLEIGHQWK